VPQSTTYLGQYTSNNAIGGISLYFGLKIVLEVVEQQHVCQLLLESVKGLLTGISLDKTGAFTR